MKDIKLIMADIDGTLLTSEHIVTEKTKEAISKAREKGILFGIATGRVLDEIGSSAAKWGVEHLCDVYVCAQGSQVRDKKTNREEHTYILSGQECMEIFNHFKDLDVNFHIFADRIAYSYKENDMSEWVEKATGFKPLPLEPESLFKSSQVKLIMTCKEEYMGAIEERAKSLKNEKYRGFRSDKRFYEYVPAQVSKSNGIREIVKMNGFELENVLAFGDADNDLEMIRDCGVGVCMENGFDTVKEVADYITDSNDEGGIASFIEKYILV
ncbi:MAG: Cof-type HAD-IIB family hydrolase [Oscillospiraceae bacterium]|nr:Cof-type HAD-IIB family hydrolase [Oscillospiraceae bacterium]